MLLAVTEDRRVDLAVVSGKVADNSEERVVDIPGRLLGHFDQHMVRVRILEPRLVAQEAGAGAQQVAVVARVLTDYRSTYPDEGSPCHQGSRVSP